MFHRLPLHERNSKYTGLARSGFIRIEAAPVSRAIKKSIQLRTIGDGRAFVPKRRTCELFRAMDSRAYRYRSNLKFRHRDDIFSTRETSVAEASDNSKIFAPVILGGFAACLGNPSLFSIDPHP
jgi:hypothetical protein